MKLSDLMLRLTFVIDPDEWGAFVMAGPVHHEAKFAEAQLTTTNSIYLRFRFTATDRVDVTSTRIYHDSDGHLRLLRDQPFTSPITVLPGKWIDIETLIEMNEIQP